MVTSSLGPADDHLVVWLWIVGGLFAWLVAAFAGAVVLGRGIRVADGRSVHTGESLTRTDTVTAPAVAARVPTATARRRAVPLPPVGIALAGLAVVLMTTGYATRLAGATGPAAQLLSMDAPFSLPRLFVAALFAVAAVAAVAGAGALPGRRTWWLAVGMVSGVIAAVKAGSTVHADALGAVTDSLGSTAALAISAGAAGVVLSSLWLLSRTERRDRRRVLAVLAAYAAASVGLSAISGLAYQYGNQWYATATYLEESGEALAGVAFLVAVLVGVAPRLVLPADWALRRQVDPQTLELPQQVPGRSVADGTAAS